MNPDQLKETTMDPATRSLIRITLPAEYQDRQPVKDLVERLMGKNPEHRFNFIQANAANLSAKTKSTPDQTLGPSIHSSHPRLASPQRRPSPRFRKGFVYPFADIWLSALA